MGGRLIRGPGRLLAAGLALLLASGAARAAEAPPPPPPCPPPAPDAKTLHPNDPPDLPGSYRTLERQAVLTERLLWWSRADGPGGLSLVFGGQDQLALDGRPHTCFGDGTAWTRLGDTLTAANPHERARHAAADLARRAARLLARYRHAFFEDQAPDPALAPALAAVGTEAAALAATLGPDADPGAARALDAAATALAALADPVVDARDRVTALFPQQVRLEQAAEALAAEPAGRALPALAYEPRSGLFVLFGGDHFDYLTNDTWVFDPRARRWSRRAPPAAPSPRANARLRADGEGRLVLEGGYVYTSSTVYLAAQYRAAPGRWVYDPAADRWSGPGLEPANDRAYREGPFRPEDFLQGPRPDRAATDRRLKALPANTWVALNPPHRPHLNRGWGKVALDPRDDLVLLWGGGHSAHGGTDVAHYHLATNRWEQTVPVSFPLGQLFTSHRYPEGYTFNGRPWITTHSYNAYGYAARPGTMVFGGRVFHDYVYDPVAADWVGRFDKARAMQDKRPYFDVVMEAAGDDLYAWSRTGGLFVLNPRGDGWIRVLSPQAGMPRVLVDQSGMLYDDRRDRLVFVTQTAWRKPFDGVLYLYDRSAPGPAKVETLIPANAKAAGVTAFFGRMLYDPLSDLYWMNASLPVRDPDGRLRHIAFDPRENLWVSVAVGGANIFGKRSTPDINVINHAVDLVFDRKRGLIWAADGNGAVHVLRPDRAAMDIRPLGQVGRP